MKQIKYSSQDKQKHKVLQKNLSQLRNYLRKQALIAIKDIKHNQQLSIEDIKEAEKLFENGQSFDKLQVKQLVQKEKEKQKERKFNSTDKKLYKNIRIDKQKAMNEKNMAEKAHQKQKKDKQKNRKYEQKEKENAKKQDKQNRNKNMSFQLISYDETRKWNQVIENQKVGKYEPDEVKLLMRSLNQYLVQHNIELEWVIDQIDKQDGSQSAYRNLKMWTAVCSVLPQRPLKSTYKFLMRKLSANNKGGKWTKQQQGQLLKLHNQHGKSWKTIAKKLKRTPQNVRDKFRNLSKKNGENQKQRGEQFWKVEELVAFFKEIQLMGGTKFIKAGIDRLLPAAAEHNNKEKEVRSTYKYNSKYVISHNNVEVMQFIDADKFGRVEKSAIKWKQISDKLENKSETQCKNKYAQYMEIFNKDYSGQSSSKVISFIEQAINKMGFTDRNVKNEENINWHEWDQKQMGLSIEEAKAKWRMLKKQIKDKANQTLQAILSQAKAANQRKIAKHYFKLDFSNHNHKRTSKIINKSNDQQQLEKEKTKNNKKSNQKADTNKQLKSRSRAAKSFKNVVIAQKSKNQNTESPNQNIKSFNIIQKQLQKINTIINLNLQSPPQKTNKEEKQKQQRFQLIKKAKKIIKKQKIDRDLLIQTTKKIIRQEKQKQKNRKQTEFANKKSREVSKQIKRKQEQEQEEAEAEEEQADEEQEEQEQQ